MEETAQSLLDQITQVGQGMQWVMNKLKELKNKLKQSEKEKELLQKKLAGLKKKHNILRRENQDLNSRIFRDTMKNINVPDLPIEMWEQVFEKVEGAQNWLNLYRASSAFAFERRLRDKRTSALLPEVLQLLLQKKVITIENIWSCRLVSKEWKAKATKGFKNYLKSEEHLGKPAHIHVPGTVELHHTSSIQRFLQDMGNNQANPFVGRKVSLRSDFFLEDESPEEFWRLGIAFLEKFGKHIDNFEFACLPSKVGIIKLQECLQLIPQITGLHIDESYAPPNEEVLQNLSLQSLPALHNLERLILFSISIPTMQKILQEVCSAPEGMKRLDILNFDCSVETEMFTRFPNLEIISLNMKHSDLERFKKLSFPFRKISIFQLNELEKDGEKFMEAVFTSCMSFSDTLVNLYVLYEPVESFHENTNFPIHLPQLKKFELVVCEEVSNSETFRERKKIEFKQVGERSIWKLLPKLDTFIDHGTCYYRPK